MKNYFSTTMMIVFAAANVYAQNNVQLLPAGGNVCNPMQISLDVNGNSFNPVSYQWSNGETSPVIEIVSSGTYTLTVTGYQGNSNNLTTITKSATYNVLPLPQITALTDLWVCKGDTVKLLGAAGYDYIDWSNGASGSYFEKKMNYLGIPGSPALDTLSVSYIATVDKVCSVKSETLILRAIRKPHGVGRHFQNKMNIRPNDSIPAGLVLEYLYPVTYEMNFTEISNPLNIIKYVTTPGSKKAPANMLIPGASYSVETTPIINGKTFCTGAPSIIGIAAPAGNKLGLGFTEEEGIKTYRVYNVQGQLLLEKQAEHFNNEWLNDMTPQMLFIQKSGMTTEIVKMQIVRK